MSAPQAPKTNPAPRPRRPWSNRLSRAAWAVFVMGVGFFLLYPILVSMNFLFLFGKSPSLEELEDPKVEQPSEIYTADGVLIGKYFRENRVPVPLSKMSPLLIKALVATEDVRYYEHSGIDLTALARAASGVVTGNKSGGGSTITQQLAKNLYNTRRGETRGGLGYIPVVSTLVSKTKEWLTAVELERRYTKEEILRMYFNTVEYGSKAYGIKVAAKTFYSTSPDSLTADQAAMLVGMLNNPTAYNPRFHPEAARKRRNLVLTRMGQAGMLPATEVAALQQQPIALKYQVEKHIDGPPTYFRGAVSQFVNEWCEKNGYDMYRDGLKIYTTIDSRMQQYAEESVQDRMKRLQQQFDRFWKNRNSNPWVDEDGNEIPGFIETQMKRTEQYKELAARYKGRPDLLEQALNAKHPTKVFTWKGDGDTTLLLSPLDSLAYYKHFLHAGMMSMDPFTGQIKAWVGGLDYQFFQYDHVKQGKRQAGSTFKPFVYLTALDNGYAPCDRIRDERVTINYVEDGKPMEWKPDNVTREYTGINMTLRHAMARSVNSVTAQLTERVGWANVAKYAHKVGIKSPLLSVPSIGLGSGGDVSVYEMVNAYSTFVNQGFQSEPMIVTRIEDRNGNVIKQFDPKQRRAIPSETAWLMLYMLRGGMDEPGGTSQALWEYELWKKDNQIGGKTGTTSNYSDGWYMGVSKDLVTGVWVGGEDRSIHFQGSQQGEGGRTALPIFGKYMEKVYEDEDLGITMGPFPKYPGKISRKYICVSESEPRRRRAESVDTIVADNLLEQLNNAETPLAVPDSL
ncbi:transglycosylase domain-containing protein [Hymenobacter yonginensis]|uniref:Transglycosylase domain-containing protein n=1 Tax=Hymenobacter yonginensis TaxID=748197 RepID=A0ABY7PL23_9BACT|nr:transglycosylase domain-containing protein [Hymenobacter yonginensis]WBO83230.1 transglycosylase domain-containing protein [Hymenobacter yonginensis]